MQHDVDNEVPQLPKTNPETFDCSGVLSVVAVVIGSCVLNMVDLTIGSCVFNIMIYLLVIVSFSLCSDFVL